MDNSRKLKLLKALTNGITVALESLKIFKSSKEESGDKLNKLKMIRVILQIVLQILLIGTSVFVTFDQSDDNQTGDNPERTLKDEND
jgi:hypothetical protein